ncbi:Predicted phospholipase, patatin/cPLA2 family [Mesobacillus persicus]|uniref:Predicted phospholipase, patatin/cPLA2 family n=1 Tax=Mesobacillus persicus TaxID=930146 RepID=A0A1H8JJM3_9BACI|nr:patatin family protein [Mesobacillus persicus]SEN80685.1 Predicted phospholipase, patatin/cPLA2 family [Mesobacillus persicus]
MYRSGLVLEGGGMRGVYTAGVLEYFMEKQLYFPYIIGVSAGACHAASYISRQAGRNQQVTIGYVNHPDYISVRNLILKKELFGMDLIFDKIPNNLVPFDFQTFTKAREKFFIGTTDCETGDPVYFEKGLYGDNILKIIRASSSLPFMAPAIEFEGRKLMDGGISDPIPIRKALGDRVQKNVLILTKPKGYRKKKSSFTGLTNYFYKDFKGLTKTLETRFEIYNETLEFIEDLESNKEVFVIRPQKDLKVGRVERNQVKLSQLYEQGYKDAQNTYDSLIEWLGGIKL